MAPPTISTRPTRFPNSLSAFVRSQLARLGKITYAPLRVGPMVLDIPASKLIIHGVPLPLTEMQSEVMAVLMEPPAGHWKTHREIADKIYGDHGYGEKAAVRKHIARIRSRLQALDLGARIETAHTHGYRVVVEGMSERSDRAEEG